MGLFTSNKNAFRDAFNANNVPALRKLANKKIDTFWTVFHRYDVYKDVSAETMHFLVAETTPATWAAWWPYSSSDKRSPEDKRSFLLDCIAGNVIAAKRNDLLDIILDNRTDLNQGEANGHLMRTIIRADLPEPHKCAAMRKILAGGHDKIENAGEFLNDAAAIKFTQGIDVLAAAGFDLHAQDELLLRNAAKAGDPNLCQHLITAHKADRGLAAAKARELGAMADAAWLETFAAPDDSGAPPTVESLSAEIRELKAAYRELVMDLRETRVQLHDLRMPEKRLDKPLLPALPAPKGAVS